MYRRGWPHWLELLLELAHWTALPMLALAVIYGLAWISTELLALVVLFVLAYLHMKSYESLGGG